MSQREDGRVWDRDRMEHSTRRPEFVHHVGVAAFRPDLRVGTSQGADRHWCRFVIHERGIHKGRPFHHKWAVYAFGELARWACESIRKGDRIIVIGHERGRNSWVDADGVKHEIDDLTAWDLGQSMLRNAAYSERNEPSLNARNHRRVEEGYPEVDRRLLPPERFD